MRVGDGFATTLIRNCRRHYRANIRTDETLRPEISKAAAIHQRETRYGDLILSVDDLRTYAADGTEGGVDFKLVTITDIHHMVLQN